MSDTNERKLFEKTLRSLSASHDLSRHRAGVTWFGRKDVMPAYIDKHTNALFTGWLLRASISESP